jgi:hypothetical protein
MKQNHKRYGYSISSLRRIPDGLVANRRGHRSSNHALSSALQEATNQKRAVIYPRVCLSLTLNAGMQW